MIMTIDNLMSFLFLFEQLDGIVFAPLGLNNISVKAQSMEHNLSRPTSYQELLRSFQQAESGAVTPRAKKLVYRPQSRGTANKENLTTRTHTQSAQEKSVAHHSEWVEDEVLRDYNEKRKQRNMELAYNKFIASLTGTLSQLTGQVPPALLSHKLTYLQFLAALKEMSLIRDSYEPSPTDAVSGFWSELSAHGQNCGVFIIFTAAVLQMKRNDDDGKYSHLAKKYSELRYTRLQLLGKVKTTAEEEFPFTPAISERSRTLAASNSRSKSKNDRCLAHQKSLNNYLEESAVEELDCSPPPNPQAGNRRSQILYRLAKEKSLEKRRDKQSSEIEYQHSVKELTFQPRIHPNLVKSKPKKVIHGEQDSINRIVRGRVEREVRRIINQKGLPYNQKLFQRMKRQRYEALNKEKRNENTSRLEESKKQQQTLPAEPIEKVRKIRQPIVLSIEVDENRCQKLVIEDPSLYKEAAAKFIKDLGLGPDMYDKLLQGVERALRFQLTQVDEDSCQSEYDSTQ